MTAIIYGNIFLIVILNIKNYLKAISPILEINRLITIIVPFIEELL